MAGKSGPRLSLPHSQRLCPGASDCRPPMNKQRARELAELAAPFGLQRRVEAGFVVHRRRGLGATEYWGRRLRIFGRPPVRSRQVERPRCQAPGLPALSLSALCRLPTLRHLPVLLRGCILPLQRCRDFRGMVRGAMTSDHGLLTNGPDGSACRTSVRAGQSAQQAWFPTGRGWRRSARSSGRSGRRR
jgi:hypothetical protein